MSLVPRFVVVADTPRLVTMYGGPSVWLSFLYFPHLVLRTVGQTDGLPAQDLAAMAGKAPTRALGGSMLCARTYTTVL
jgi:hypothetical protein